MMYRHDPARIGIWKVRLDLPKIRTILSLPSVSSTDLYIRRIAYKIVPVVAPPAKNIANFPSEKINKNISVKLKIGKH
jgi:hypothetical protein